MTWGRRSGVRGGLTDFVGDVLAMANVVLDRPIGFGCGDIGGEGPCSRPGRSSRPGERDNVGGYAARSC